MCERACWLNFTAVVDFKRKEPWWWSVDDFDKEWYLKALYTGGILPAGGTDVLHAGHSIWADIYDMWFGDVYPFYDSVMVVSTTVALGRCELNKPSDLLTRAALQTLLWNLLHGNYSWLTDRFPGSIIKEATT